MRLVLGEHGTFSRLQEESHPAHGNYLSPQDSPDHPLSRLHCAVYHGGSLWSRECCYCASLSISFRLHACGLLWWCVATELQAACPTSLIVVGTRSCVPPAPAYDLRFSLVRICTGTLFSFPQALRHSQQGPCVKCRKIMKKTACTAQCFFCVCVIMTCIFQEHLTVNTFHSLVAPLQAGARSSVHQFHSVVTPLPLEAKTPSCQFRSSHYILCSYCGAACSPRQTRFIAAAIP